MARTISQNSGLACRARMWKNFFDSLILNFHLFENPLFLQIRILLDMKEIFTKFSHFLSLCFCVAYMVSWISLTGWLCQLVSLWIVAVFSHSFMKLPWCHPNIFSLRIVCTVWLCTFPIVDAIFTVATDWFNNFMFVARDLAHYLTTVW